MYVYLCTMYIVRAVEWQRFRRAAVGTVNMSQSHRIHWSWSDRKAGAPDSGDLQPH